MGFPERADQLDAAHVLSLERKQVKGVGGVIPRKRARARDRCGFSEIEDAIDALRELVEQAKRLHEGS